jgi:hypothetical protein
LGTITEKEAAQLESETNIHNIARWISDTWARQKMQGGSAPYDPVVYMAVQQRLVDIYNFTIPLAALVKAVGQNPRDITKTIVIWRMFGQAGYPLNTSPLLADLFGFNYLASPIPPMVVARMAMQDFARPLAERFFMR